MKITQWERIVAARARHTDLIDAVNDAKTEDEHQYADVFLQGWRAGVDAAGGYWSGTGGDMHTMNRFGKDRPMCCGVLIDWKPERGRV